MAKIGKIIGAAAGFALGGPIGALIGLAIGSVFDNTSVTVQSGRSAYGQRVTPADFALSLMVLIAAVMKADGAVKRAELDFVKAYLRQAYGEQATLELLQILRDVLQKEIPLYEVCTQIKSNMTYAARLELLHFLYKIALSDTILDQAEMQIISDIAKYLGISQNDSQSIKATFYDDLESAYQALEITSEASDEEVKKAYKKMAVKYHPDKVSNMGEEVQKSATEKFKKINEAFDRIKKQRGIK
ncbi:MAG TPA: TerB family tellurite resistance protein [Bacteroidales bacterium]|nr:TerB family tellurite resistance protein [Bacteroidales bacterium]